jgi:hypothetical protein
MNEMIKNPNRLPVELETEADNILAAAKEDAGFDKLLKFIKGKYYVGPKESRTEIPLGSQFIAHASQWTKCWIKFADGKVVQRHMGKVAEGYVPPEREELDDTDQGKWAIVDGKPRDPWRLDYILPMEEMEKGEVCVFTTPSIGGHIAVSDLCAAYAKRVKKGLRGPPVVQLGVADMPTKKYGMVPRPDFIIEGWDDAAGGGGGVDEMKIINATKRGDMDDEIPF